MISFITSEISLGQYVCEFVFGVNVFDFHLLGSRLIRSNSQSRATLCVLETCLIVGLLPFLIILIAASLSSNTYKNFLVRRFHVSKNKININQIIDHFENACVLDLCEGGE